MNKAIHFASVTVALMLVASVPAVAAVQVPRAVALCTYQFANIRRRLAAMLAGMSTAVFGRVSRVPGPPKIHFAGMTAGVRLSFSRSTTNFAGFVRLAFRPIVCTSLGPS